MTLQLGITNPQDAELILSLVRRLNIPFKKTKKRLREKANGKKGEKEFLILEPKVRPHLVMRLNGKLKNGKIGLYLLMKSDETTRYIL